MGSIPGLGRSPGEGKGNPFQYSCLENHMDRGTWWATIHEVAESNTTEQLILALLSLQKGYQTMNISLHHDLHSL